MISTAPAMVSRSAARACIERARLETHHAIDVAPNGEILAPGRHQLKQVGPGSCGLRVAEDGFVWDDPVVRLAPIAPFEPDPHAQLLLANGRAASSTPTAVEPNLPDADDPLHLNDVEVLREDMAAAFRSRRSDLRSQCATSTQRAVSRRQNARGEMRGGPAVHPPARPGLPAQRATSSCSTTGWAASGAASAEPGPFGSTRRTPSPPSSVLFTERGRALYTDHRGKLQVLPNGQHPGRRIAGRPRVEIAREGGDTRLVWEWVNGLGDGLVDSSPRPSASPRPAGVRRPSP